MTNLHFWAKGHCVSTVGYDEAAVRRYIREQEERDSGQMSLEIEQVVNSPTGAFLTQLPPSLWGAS